MDIINPHLYFIDGEYYINYKVISNKSFTNSSMQRSFPLIG